MPGDPLLPVSDSASGLIGGAAFNKFAEDHRAYLRTKFSATSLADAPDETGNVCLVKNNTTSNLKRFNVLGIGAPIITASANEDEFKRLLTVKGETPSSTYFGKFVVLLENIPAGEMGRGQLAGVVQCYIDVKYTHHRYADLDGSEVDHLDSCLNGSACILTPITSTGLQWCLVRLGLDAHGRTYEATSDGTISSGSSGTVSVYDAGSDSGENVTAYLNWMEGTSTAASGDELLIKWHADKVQWGIANKEC